MTSTSTTIIPASGPVDGVPGVRSDGAPLLQLSAISKRWRKASTPLLDEVDLHVPAASTVYIGGRNGVGKTTLLRVIAGLILPDTGDIRLGSTKLCDGDRAYRSRIGLVSAGNSGLYARMTVSEHLRYQSGLDLLSSTARKIAVNRARVQFRLANFADTRADRLSTGQRQRLRLALAMLRDPDVLALDEPESGLDAEGVKTLWSTVSEFVKRERIVLWASPKDGSNKTAFDYRFFIRDGKLIAYEDEN
jgi:ABC-2 type transport system ATP-binding protein